MARTGKKGAEPRPAWMRSKKLVAFIGHLKHHGNVTQALKAAGCSRQWAYEKRELDRDFADTWAAAVRIGNEALIDEAKRRAYEGVLEPKTVGGERELVRKYSDTLLMFLIKQHDPSYRERYSIEHGNADGRPFLFQFQLHPAVAQAKAASS